MPHRSRVVIDRVRKDGLVFASDYTDCDNGMDGFRKVLFRLPAGAPCGAQGCNLMIMEGGSPPEPLARREPACTCRSVTPPFFMPSRPCLCP